jgi:peptide/nickel transport system permease protein
MPTIGKGPAVLLGILGLIGAAAIFAPLLTPYATQGLGAPNLVDRLIPPSAVHPFGTDGLGRDLLARCLFGLRSTLAIGVSVVGISLVFGTIVGVMAGYFGGWIDELIMRTTDIFLAFPGFLLAITLAMVFSPGTLSAIVALSITWWPWYTRIARAQSISVRDRDFVRAARSMGVSDGRIIARHILPNVLVPTQVQATQDLGAAILAGAALGFLGLGTQDPAADLGRMINEARIGLLVGDWWLIVFPGAIVYLTVIVAMSLGDAMQSTTRAR